MSKSPITFDQLPGLVFELGRKVDNLTMLLFSQQQAAAGSGQEIGGIQLAADVTGLSKARIYTLVAERKIPHKKRGNKLYFERNELINWINEGSRQQRKRV